MPKLEITKYYYHNYLILIMFILLSIGTTLLLFGNFIPTQNVKIYSFLISSLLYLCILFYFITLYKRQQWLIPSKWKNVQRKPFSYCICIFPVIFIAIFWMNFSYSIPVGYTQIFGKKQSLFQTAKPQKIHSRGKTTYYLNTTYSYLPIFKISEQQFQQYQNQHIILRITVLQSSMGTIIQSIDHVELSFQNN